jgi:hypothetical protein
VKTDFILSQAFNVERGDPYEDEASSITHIGKIEQGVGGADMGFGEAAPTADDVSGEPGL